MQGSDYNERDQSWLRRKHPLEDKWPRFTAEVPPELAEALDLAQRKSLGVNATSQNATRANMVRAALRLYLNTVDPLPDEAIEGTAVEIFDLSQIEA
jgi:hypothetical protein